MIFVGDIALPHPDAIKINFPHDFYEKSWFGNLEGAIIEIDDPIVPGIYNNKSAVNVLCKLFNFAGFSLANNHIFDFGSLETTIQFLDELNIPVSGVGHNIEQASKAIILKEGNCEIIIVSFGWEVIQCKVTTGKAEGVNPLIKSHVIKTVKQLVESHKNARVVPFMHWCYELEGQPQPFERELAKQMIDIGAAGVIGCHSHCVGSVEFYKEKPIIYGLGNWMFKQRHFFKGRHKFPSFCNEQLAFEWDFEHNEFKFHFFEYNPLSSELNFISSEDKQSAKVKALSSFTNFTADEYKAWYKANRYHKGKGLPIYYWDDGLISRTFKDNINKIRDLAIKLIHKIKKQYD